MSEKETYLIKTENLSVGFRQRGNTVMLFENLNLALEAGELVCFMGPNGVGKTSLIRTLTGIQKPLAGNLVTTGNKSIGLVLTDRITASHMTVYDLISYGRYPYLNWTVSLSDTDKEVIQRAIDQVHVGALIHKQLFELSDGQLQMVMIAKALAQDTPVLILDEPTAHLDLNNRVEIMNTLRELSRTTNKAILLATHELDLALQTADKIWLATGQNSIVSGIPEDLVLNGTFDSVFQLKGFDLKTGKIYHKAHRDLHLQLIGSGHELLWTKNALVRNGYEVANQSDIKIEIKPTAHDCSWSIRSKDLSTEFNSLENLLNSLSQMKSVD